MVIRTVPQIVGTVGFCIYGISSLLSFILSKFAGAGITDRVFIWSPDPERETERYQVNEGDVISS